MSRSQGAANGGWPGQRHPAAEPDPHSGGRPAPRQQQAPQYAPQPQQQAPYPQQAYEEQQVPQGYGAPPQAYHYPQQHQQHPHPQPQYTPHAPAPQPINRQGLSSLDSARNAQPTHDFENYPRTQPPQYARPMQQAPRSPFPPADNPVPTMPVYRQAPPQQAAPQYAAPTGYEQWPAADPYAPQDHGGYAADAPFPANSNQPYADPLQQADWSMPAASYGDPALEQQSYGHGHLGYEQQQHAGALAPTYNTNEAAAYETDEPRRASWTMRIAGAIVVAIGLGYGLAQAYKSVLGTPADAPTPVISSDSSPAREKPSDPGGKQFSHMDSKVLGRLSDGGQESADASSGGLSESDTSNGARQVKTLVVGRDGQIAPPAESSMEAEVSVPGLTVVDAFGSAAQHSPQPMAPRQEEPEAAPPLPKARVNVKSTKVIPSSTASLREDEADAAPAPPKRQKVAAAPAASDEGATSASGANGYVVVLASVPASGNSRLDALRKFADLQQQYGPVLANKTPDVRETTLAGKGAYHRLLVGPPSSRSQASDLCVQLKASGYKDCWVTAY